MGYAHPAEIEAGLLAWAMARGSTTASELAKSTGATETKIEEWLAGHSHPTFRQAQKLCKRLRIPFGFLFLDQPPPSDFPLPDFRTIGSTEIVVPSVDLHDVVLATLRRRDWLSEYLRQSQEEPVEVVGIAKGWASERKTTNDIRERLRLGEVQQRPRQTDAFLRLLVERTEELGVNVSRNGVVGNNTNRPLDVQEFRGFCISDPYAPFIFINGVDSYAGQVFTIIHELAHIWYGESGISGIELPSNATYPQEALCNRIAAEVLVPEVEFLRVWEAHAATDDAIEEASQHFRVSRHVIAIRACDKNLIDRGDLDNLLRIFRNQSLRRGSGTGGDFYRTLIARNGRAFTTRVLEALNRQHVLTRDAAGLLETKSGNLTKVPQALS